MSNIGRWAATGAILALLTITACQNRATLDASAEPDGTGATGERSLVQFPDIPIPSGATMDLDRSLVLGARDAWIGRLAMHVGDGQGKLYDFYSREMARFGWREITSVRSDVSVLTYSRGDRVATVQIRNRTLRGTFVDVTISPRRQGTPPRANVAVESLR